jgi:endonuclease-3
MRIAEKSQRIMTVLDKLYPAPPIPLLHSDAFTLLVSVVLSAQTTDKMVNQVTPTLFERAHTPEAMAALSVEEIQGLIKKIGLAPQKSKALKGLAQRLVEVFDSTVPNTMEDLQSLSGVGRKTANVVMAQAFGEPAFPVDTHIHRLAARWGLSKAKTPDRTEKDLCRVFPRESWNKLHLQIIYFGREHCPALYHSLEHCPICSWAATKQRREEEQKRNQGRHSKRRSTAG